jgi:hypothetical protein
MRLILWSAGPVGVSLSALLGGVGVLKGGDQMVECRKGEVAAKGSFLDAVMDKEFLSLAM